MIAWQGAPCLAWHKRVGSWKDGSCALIRAVVLATTFWLACVRQSADSELLEISMGGSNCCSVSAAPAALLFSCDVSSSVQGH